MRPDACGICLLKQTASGAQSVTSPSKIEEFREFEADLSALFRNLFIKDSQSRAQILNFRKKSVRMCSAAGLQKQS